MALWTDVLKCLEDNRGWPEERPSGRGTVPWSAVGSPVPDAVVGGSGGRLADTLVAEEMVTAWWGPGVMQIDGVTNSGCTCYRPYAGRSREGSTCEAVPSWRDCAVLAGGV